MKQVSLLFIYILLMVSCGDKNESGANNNQNFQHSYTGQLININGTPGMQTQNAGIIALQITDQSLFNQLNSIFMSGSTQNVTVSSDAPLSYANTNQFSTGQFPTFHVKAIFNGVNNNSFNNGQTQAANRICGSISNTGSFNATYIFYTSTSQLRIVGGDARTSEILRQLPPGRTAHNVCATVVGSQNGLTAISNIGY